MPFTPNAYAEGDYVVINEPLSNADGTFSAGTEFEIIGALVRHGVEYYDLRDHRQNLLFGVPASQLRLSRFAGS